MRMCPICVSVWRIKSTREAVSQSAQMGIEKCAMSRVLAKLELHRYIARQRDGTDKLVNLLGA
jgi:DNA-binding MarR family transcriptional regulator